MATIIHEDGRREVITLPRDSNGILQELQTHVGGYIEMIRLADARVMVVNEEGTLKGLPVNESATRVLRRYLGDGVVDIVGPAVVADYVEIKS